MYKYTYTIREGKFYEPFLCTFMSVIDEYSRFLQPRKIPLFFRFFESSSFFFSQEVQLIFFEKWDFLPQIFSYFRFLINPQRATKVTLANKDLRWRVDLDSSTGFFAPLPEKELKGKECENDFYCGILLLLRLFKLTNTCAEQYLLSLKAAS